MVYRILVVVGGAYHKIDFHVLIQKLHIIMELTHRLTIIQYGVLENFDPPLDPPLVNKTKQR